MVADGDTVKRKIRELRVVELRNELENRGLDKTGVKALLVDRLTKALQDEGENPEEYLFETSEKRAVKRNSVGKLEHDSMSNPDSTADLTDVSNIQEVEEDLKEESEKNETAKKEVSTEKNCEEVKEKKGTEQEEGSVEPAKDTSQDSKLDAGSNHENNDVVEDCINLNLEDEENFDEEENNSKEKDESPTQRRGITRHEEKIKTGSSGVGPGQAPTTKDSMEAKISSSTASTSNGNEEHGTTIEEKESKSTTLDTSSATLSSGDKAKSGSSLSKDGTKNSPKDERDKKKTAGSSMNSRSSRNLWVSGLSSTTKAGTDLKHHFSKHGKVIGAKVVTNARSPGARCFGIITMATSEEASKCIQHLHHTELHGRMISVEKYIESGPRKAEGKSEPALSSESNTSEQKVSDKTDVGETVQKADTGETEVSFSAAGDSSVASVCESTKEKDENKSTVKDEKDAKTQQQRNKSRDRTEKRDRHRRPSPNRPRQPVLTFHHIREERERQRQREREREEREIERRRRDEVNRLREHERRQREEAMRLEKDRERLRMDREKFEREKAELLRLERERQRLEREKLEREREEFRKQARSLVEIEEARRAVKRPAPSDRDEYFSERKRLTVESSMRFEPQPSPRFDTPKSKNFVEFRSSKPMEANRGYDNRNRYERTAPTVPPPATITRRVVQEVANPRRDARPSPPSPPHRERDDRRVVERVRDDRFTRGNRGNIGREVFADRERDRERPREREPVRNRLDRDHHERFSDSRSKGSDMRSFNDRSSDSWRSGGGVASGSTLGGAPKSSYGSTGGGNMGNILGNGGAVPHLTPRESHHVWGAANERKTEASMLSSMNSSGGGNASTWSGQNSSADRWNSSLMPIGRSMGATPGGFNNNWSGSAGPLNSSVYNSAAGSLGSLSNVVLGQSGSGNYSADRYSRH